MTDERWKECKHHHDGCACREHAWAEQVAKLEAAVARLKGEVATHCVYYCACCGKRFLLLASDAKEQIGQHIGECPRHPMRIVEAERGAALTEVVRLQARVLKLEALNEHLDEESGQRDCAALMAEVERLREAIKTAHADGASALVASFENTDPRARVCELEAEVERLEGETYCAYCGERFLLDAPDSVERIGQHIAECPKHPMRIAEAERGAALAEVERLKGELNNQECDTAYWKEQVSKKNMVVTDLEEEIEEERCNAVITAAEERAAIVAWLTKRYENTSYLEVVRIVTKQFAEMIERGEHWPTEGGTL